MGKKSNITILVMFLIPPVVALLIALLVPAALRARMEADRAVSATNMKAIDTACYLYTNANNGQWPESLEALVEQGLLPAKSLINPGRPKQKSGYVYIRPASPADERPPVLMIYEAYDEWGEGIQTVGCRRGHIADEAEFKKLLAQAHEEVAKATKEKRD